MLEVLVHGTRADDEDLGDVAVGLARSDPAQHVEFARGERQPRRPRQRCHRARIAAPRPTRSFEHCAAAKQTGDRRAYPIEQRHLTIVEVIAGAIQHEADEPTLSHVHRQCHGVVDADRPVVLVIQRGLTECGKRHRVADAVHELTAVDGVVANQRMRVEMPVEARACLGADRARWKADDVAAVAAQVAQRQGRQLGRREPRQLLDAAARECFGVVDRVGQVADEVERCLQIAAAQRILDNAARLVQTRGFNGFSYADIAAELKVSKASLHYHFPSKAELGRRLIERYESTFVDAFDAIDRHAADEFDKLRRYAGIYAAALGEQRMCLCGMLAAEHGTLPEPMREVLQHYFDVNERWLAAVLEAGRAAGTLHFEGEAREVAGMLLGALEGALMLARSYADPKRFSIAADRLLADLRLPAPARAARPRKTAPARASVSRSAPPAKAPRRP